MNVIDNFGVGARIANFDKRNGGRPVFFNNWYYYANGAQREGWALGVLIEPPDDEYQRLANILKYHEARQAIAVREFDNLKEELAMSGCPQPEGLDQLRQLRLIVGQRNQAVNDAKTRLEGTERGRQVAWSRRQHAEEQQQMAAYRAQLKQIRI
jgi:hypothetical protein